MLAHPVFPHTGGADMCASGWLAARRSVAGVLSLGDLHKALTMCGLLRGGPLPG